MPPKHTLEVELGSKIFVRKYFARQIDLGPHSRPKPTTLVQSPENRRTSKVSPKDFRSRRAHGRELRTSILQKTLSFQIRKVTIFGTRHARQQIVARGKVGRLAERRAAGRANRAAAHLRWWTRLLRSCRAGHERDTLPLPLSLRTQHPNVRLVQPARTRVRANRAARAKLEPAPVDKIREGQGRTYLVVVVPPLSPARHCKSSTRPVSPTVHRRWHEQKFGHTELRERSSSQHQ